MRLQEERGLLSSPARLTGANRGNRFQEVVSENHARVSYINLGTLDDERWLLGSSQCIGRHPGPVSMIEDC